MSIRSKTTSVTELKARCLGLIDEVEEHGVEYVITRRGRPVARLVPVARSLPSSRDSWKNQVEIRGDIVECDWSEEFDASRDE